MKQDRRPPAILHAGSVLPEPFAPPHTRLRDDHAAAHVALSPQLLLFRMTGEEAGHTVAIAILRRRGAKAKNP